MSNNSAWHGRQRSSEHLATLLIAGLHPTRLLERGIRDFIRERESSPVHLLDAAIEAVLGSEADVNDPMMIRLQ
jgi:hypothetical protein